MIEIMWNGGHVTTIAGNQLLRDEDLIVVWDGLHKVAYISRDSVRYVRVIPNEEK